MNTIFKEETIRGVYKYQIKDNIELPQTKPKQNDKNIGINFLIEITINKDLLSSLLDKILNPFFDKNKTTEEQ